MDDSVISGPETTHQAYEQITAGDKEDEDAPGGELQSHEQQLFQQQVIPLDSKKYSSLSHHTPKRKQQAKHHSICEQEPNYWGAKACNKDEGHRVYVNEHLPKRNAEIAQQARILMKERVNGPPEEAKVKAIRDIPDQYNSTDEYDGGEVE